MGSAYSRGRRSCIYSPETGKPYGAAINRLPGFFRKPTIFLSEYIDMHQSIGYTVHMTNERSKPAFALDCCSSTGRHYPDSEEAALLFRALGDETRLSILRQLREQEEVCACDFTACCELAQPTVSHHLKVLREAGLIVGDKRGLWVHYRLNRERMARLRELLP